MSNDLRIGLACGVACVFAVAILFYQRPPAPETAVPPKPATVQAESLNPAPASIPGGPLPRPSNPPTRALANPLP
jgi:hypothetical protein